MARFSHRSTKTTDLGLKPGEVRDATTGPRPTTWKLLGAFFTDESSTKILKEAQRNLGEARRGRVTDPETARKYAMAGNFFGMARARESERGFNGHSETARKEISSYRGAIRVYEIVMKMAKNEDLAVIKIEYADVRIRLAKVLGNSDPSDAIQNTVRAMQELGDAEWWYRREGHTIIADEVAELKMLAGETLAALKGKKE
ncbi:MAG: hypothetical protein NT157_01245 [Candidatus Micrarchaeota archaeon]|nr:hypothetical protein [Candidatus Micrarchaeota archaeon]